MTRVLYVNHTARVSGAERTLLDLLRALPPDLTPTVASPEGRLRDEVTALGVEHLPLPECDVSLKLEPRTTSKGMVQLVRAGSEAGRLARRVGARFVHAFSIRAGLGCGLASDAPLVVHAHDALGSGPASRGVAEVISRRARLILAASPFVAERLPRGRWRAPVTVVDNPVDLETFDPAQASATAVRAEIGIPEDAHVVTVVGQITPWKGQDLALRVLAGLREHGLDAHLLVVGAPVFTSNLTRHDNIAYQQSLMELQRTLGLADLAHFLGEREDVPAVLAGSDLTLVPSWEEPFGRIVVESMAMGVPVLATARGGPASILSDGGGLTLPPDDVAVWVEVAHKLLMDPAGRAGMGELGSVVARRRFGLDRWVERVAAAYAEVAA
ncbi:MAG TPA: glycosyltransferase family 4 protein [Thermoleophilaceae bacterium]|jgi:glycosyltransferase involved in cell wall biosynthesis